RLGGARARRRGHARRAGCRRSLGWLRMADMTHDEIVLTGLTVCGRHGVFEHERVDGQEFTIDLRLRLSLADAAASDDVADTVHYGELAETVAAVVAGEPVNLIETLAQRIADVALADPRVRSAVVTVHKPHAPIPLTFADVAVTIERSRT